MRAGRDGDDDLGAHLVGHVEEAAELGIGVAELLDGRGAGERRNEASDVRTGEKVLVSCIIIATTIFWRAIDGLPQGAAG